MNKNAIAILCRYPSNIWLNFFENFNEYDIYIIIDENVYDYYELYKNYNFKLKFVQIDDNFCKNNGFYNFVYHGILSNTSNKPFAWDKALLYFTIIKPDYNNVWFIEDDVFLLKESVLINIDNKYLDSDLLTPFHHLNYDGNLNTWDFWFIMNDIPLPLPWARSMTCACRASNKLLKLMNNYRKDHNKLFFHEAMFNTISLQNNLIVDTPEELSTIHYRDNFDLNNLNLNYLYHPIKNYHDQLSVREKNSIYYHNCFNDIDYSKRRPFNNNIGLFLLRNYILPEGFNFCCYRENNDMKNWCDEDIVWHWFTYGQYEHRKYKD